MAVQRRYRLQCGAHDLCGERQAVHRHRIGRMLRAAVRTDQQLLVQRQAGPGVAQSIQRDGALRLRAVSKRPVAAASDQKWTRNRSGGCGMTLLTWTTARKPSDRAAAGFSWSASDSRRG